MGRDPKAEIEITAQSRGLQARLREARVKFDKFGAELRRDVFGKDLIKNGGFFGKAGAHMVGGLGARAVGDIGSLITESARGALSFQDQLVRLQIASDSTAAEMQAFGDSARRSSVETGIGADKILGAARAYVALTGDMKGAAAASAQWARIAQATESNIDDIAKTAAALRTNLKIDPSDMEAAFSALAVEGKAGAVEIKDLATQMSEIAPAWSRFGRGLDLQGLKELGATLQVVKYGFGADASKTIVGTRDLLMALVQSEKHFKSHGINVYEKDGKHLRNVRDIVRDISKSKFFEKPTNLHDVLGGRGEAFRAMQEMLERLPELDQLVEKAGDAQTIMRDFGKYMESPAGKMAASMEMVKNKVAEIFTPERIELFANALERVVGGVAGALEKIEDVWDRITGGGKEQPANPYDEAPDAQKPKELSKWGLDALPAAIQLAKAGMTMNAHDQAASLPGSVGDLERTRLANRKGFESAWSSIVGKGTRAEQVKAAERFANPSIEELHAPGGLGRMDAANQYIQKRHVSPDEQKTAIEANTKDAQEAFVRDMGALLDRLGTRLVDAFAKQDGRPITVKADGNKIVDVQRNASQHARRPGG